MSDDKPATPPPKKEKVDPMAAAVESPALDRLMEGLPGSAGEPHFFAGEVTVPVEADQLVRVCTFLKADAACSFELLSDIAGADFPDRERRFRLAYHLVSVRHNRRLRLTVSAADGQQVPSVTGVWPGADWFEREVYDMYGVEFTGHPNLVRVLMPDDWVGYPLRKDYPLPGYPEQHLRYRHADVTRRSYVDISWKAAGEKAAEIVKKFKGREPVKERSPHVPEAATPGEGSGGS